MSRIEIITRGIILSVVRIFSVIPDNEIPVILSQQKAPIIPSSIKKHVGNTEVRYILTNALAMVEIPKSEEMR